MASLRQSRSNYRCNAWLPVVFDSIASRYHKQQVKMQKSHHRHYYQKSLLNQWRNLNIQSIPIDRHLPFNPICRHNTILPMSPTSTTTAAVTAERSNDPSDQLKNEINQRIYDVARTMCNLSANQIAITWKSKRIVVTVNTENAFLDATKGDRDDNDEDDIEIDFIDEEDFLDDDDDREDISVDSTFNAEIVENKIDETCNGEFLAESSSSRNNFKNNAALEEDITAPTTTTTTTTADMVDLTLLARSINAALDDGEDGIGTRITQLYEIEVSTPGIMSDDITTPRMFAAYRGFDIIVHHFDPKKKVMKLHEGRLVEKNEEHVIINQKGRMKHFKNIHVQAVKLPKFKKEKGSR